MIKYECQICGLRQTSLLDSMFTSGNGTRTYVCHSCQKKRSTANNKLIASNERAAEAAEDAAREHRRAGEEMRDAINEQISAQRQLEEDRARREDISTVRQYVDLLEDDTQTANNRIRALKRLEDAVVDDAVNDEARLFAARSIKDFVPTHVPPELAARHEPALEVSLAHFSHLESIRQEREARRLAHEEERQQEHEREKSKAASELLAATNKLGAVLLFGGGSMVAMLGFAWARGGFVWWVSTGVVISLVTKAAKKLTLEYKDALEPWQDLHPNAKPPRFLDRELSPQLSRKIVVTIAAALALASAVFAVMLLRDHSHLRNISAVPTATTHINTSKVSSAVRSYAVAPAPTSQRGFLLASAGQLTALAVDVDRRGHVISETDRIVCDATGCKFFSIALSDADRATFVGASEAEFDPSHAAGVRLVTATAGVNVRNARSTSSTRLRTVPNGTLALAIVGDVASETSSFGDANAWLFVVASDGTTGWSSSQYWAPSNLALSLRPTLSPLMSPHETETYLENAILVASTIRRGGRREPVLIVSSCDANQSTSLLAVFERNEPHARVYSTTFDGCAEDLLLVDSQRAGGETLFLQGASRSDRAPGYVDWLVFGVGNVEPLLHLLLPSGPEIASRDRVILRTEVVRGPGNKRGYWPVALRSATGSLVSYAYENGALAEEHDPDMDPARYLAGPTVPDEATEAEY